MVVTNDRSYQPESLRTKTEFVDRAVKSREIAAYDIVLVRRFKAGDDSAFVEIVARYRDKISFVAFSMLKNHADAEEIAQDTFIRAYRGLEGFRGDSSLATWLHQIAVNLSRNRYWYFYRRRRSMTLSFDYAFVDDSQAKLSDLVATDTAGPAREAVTREFSQLIEDCTEKLGDHAREILMLRSSLDHSYAEIARELNINVGTVKSRLARARESLRLLLAEHCPEFGPDARLTAWFDSVRPAGGVEVVTS